MRIQICPDDFELIKKEKTLVTSKVNQKQEPGAQKRGDVWNKELSVRSWCVVLSEKVNFKGVNSSGEMLSFDIENGKVHNEDRI